MRKILAQANISLLALFLGWTALIAGTAQAVSQTDVTKSKTPAAEAGLKPGDVVQEINRQPVKTADEAVHLTEHLKDKVTLLRIWSNGGSHYVVVDESKAEKD